MIRLTTDRMLIRDPLPNDLDSHHQLLTDSVAMFYLQDVQTASWDASRENLDTALAEAARIRRKCYYFRMEDKNTGELIGQIGYTVIDDTPIGKLADIGYFTFQKYWGQGYT